MTKAEGAYVFRRITEVKTEVKTEVEVKMENQTNGSSLTAAKLRKLGRSEEDVKVRVAKWLRNNEASNPDAVFKAMDDIISDFKEVEEQNQSSVS